ncbi:hypothetical protein ACQP3J_29585, partial [Escherichia coli]
IKGNEARSRYEEGMCREDHVQEDRCPCLTDTRESTQGKDMPSMKVLFLDIVLLDGMEGSKKQADV